ncbi:hypothetical protein [Polymorphospora rubra]|uniref:hypothetical protein n=1 Tax=Polymorphospora rubra TaxID=338584 RepID=UPI001BB3F271|nr:hypothetical protein [Polymorphospora rubra]
MESPSPRHLTAFVRSIAILALQAETQLAWLSRFDGRSPTVDELALEFDDGFGLVPTFIERGWLSNAAVSVLTQLSSQLDSMSGDHNAHLWCADALSGRLEWDRIRASARAALMLLD